jgi:hypothetical protein
MTAYKKVQRSLDRLLDLAYGCVSGVLRLAGQRYWARYVLSARVIQSVRTHVGRLQNAVDDVQRQLKLLTDDLCVEQTKLEHALQDVRSMTEKRIEEKRTRAYRIGIPFQYKTSDVFMWMNDYSEIETIRKSN